MVSLILSVLTTLLPNYAYAETVVFTCRATDRDMKVKIQITGIYDILGDQNQQRYVPTSEVVITALNEENKSPLVWENRPGAPARKFARGTVKGTSRDGWYSFTGRETNGSTFTIEGKEGQKGSARVAIDLQMTADKPMFQGSGVGTCKFDHPDDAES